MTIVRNNIFNHTNDRRDIFKFVSDRFTPDECDTIGEIARNLSNGADADRVRDFIHGLIEINALSYVRNAYLHIPTVIKSLEIICRMATTLYKENPSKWRHHYNTIHDTFFNLNDNYQILEAVLNEHAQEKNYESASNLRLSPGRD